MADLRPVEVVLFKLAANLNLKTCLPAHLALPLYLYPNHTAQRVANAASKSSPAELQITLFIYLPLTRRSVFVLRGFGSLQAT